MRRRDFLRSCSGAALALALGGCGDSKTGPVPVKAGRDVCELCRMIISEVQFAAEVRGGAKAKMFKFDDIGCAVHWLRGMEWKDDPATEFWVMDYRTGTTWLDARAAAYVPGIRTPMDYGFGAVAAPEPGTVPYTVMVDEVVARGVSPITG